MLECLNKKGFVLIHFLLYFVFISNIYLYYLGYFQLEMKWLKNREYLYERLELEHFVIRRIESEFQKYEEKDFELHSNDSDISVTYQDIIAIIVVTGKFNFKAELIFDDFCECILEYNYLNE